MKKKTYEQPEMKVVKLESASIICTSGAQTPGLDPDETPFAF